MTNLFVTFYEKHYSFWEEFTRSQGKFAYPNLKLDQALDFAFRCSGLRKARFIAKRKSTLLQLFSLTKKHDRLIGELSQGEQKKTLILMELVALKANLIFSNPLKNLDEASKRRFVAMLFLLETGIQSNFQINVTPKIETASLMNELNHAEQ